MPKEGFAGEYTELVLRWGERQDAALIMQVKEYASEGGENSLTIGFEYDGITELIKTLQRIQRSLTSVEAGDVVWSPSAKVDNLYVGTKLLSTEGPNKGCTYVKSISYWTSYGKKSSLQMDDVPRGKYVVVEVPPEEFESFEPHASTGPHLQVTYNNAVNNGAGPVDDSDVDSVYPGDAVDSTPLV